MIVIATDATNESTGAVRCARELALRDGGSLHAVSVCEPMPIIVDSMLIPLLTPEDMEAARRVRGVAVDGQIAKALGPGLAYVTSVRTGRIASELASYAASVKADLIITGRGRHGVIDRVLGEEHLGRLLRDVDCPVIAVEPGQTALPRRIVVGVDFSANGVNVARAALAVSAADAAIYLVHVKPDPPFGVPHPGQWLKSYDDGVHAGLDRLRSQLALPPSRVVEPVVLHGHPGSALADFAKSASADLIAVGVHGAGFFSRLVIGTVTNHLLRTAPCSLLAVPASSIDGG